MKMRYVFVALAISSACCFGSSSSDSINPALSNALRCLYADSICDTVKVIWDRSLTGDFNFPNGDAKVAYNEILMGFSTVTGREDTIIKTPANIQRPMICKSGKRIVYSNISEKKIYVVNWDDSAPKPRELTYGCAGALWYDEKTGKEYVIYCDNMGGVLGTGLYGMYAVRRMNIDNPSEDSAIYNADRSKNIAASWLGISSDGKVLGAVWQYGQNVSCLDISGPSPKELLTARGCWSSMPYDTNYRLVVDIDAHNGWVVYAPGCRPDSSAYKVFPGLDVGMPRMATYHTRVMCFAATQTTGGGDIIIAIMNDTLNKILNKITVTKVDATDGFPDLWHSAVRKRNCPGDPGCSSAAIPNKRAVSARADIVPSTRMLLSLAAAGKAKLYELGGREVTENALNKKYRGIVVARRIDSPGKATMIPVIIR